MKAAWAKMRSTGSKHDLAEPPQHIATTQLER